MRLSLLLLGYFLMLAFTLLSQIDEDLAYLSANEILTAINEDGGLFWDGSSDPVYIVPYQGDGDYASAIFASNIWVTMIDDEENVRGAYSTFNPSFNYPFTSGMLDPLTGMPFDINPPDKVRVFSVSRSQIVNLLDDVADGVIDLPIPSDILEWPARGNVFYEGLLDNHNVAPFNDQSGDGIYNPLDGDYPIIGQDMQDVIPDQLLYMITNDSQSDASASVEVHTILYAFYCENGGPVNQSIYQRNILYNRSAVNYSDLNLGHWVDYDLGCGTDDGVACEPQRDAFYVYNFDAVDGDTGENESSCSGGVNTYSSSAFNGTKILNNDLESFVGYVRADLATSFPTESFNTLNEASLILNGIFPDGTPITPYGTGYNPDDTTTPPTKHMFSDNPNDPNAWITESSDHRVVGSQFAADFPSGSRLVFDLVHTFTGSDVLNNLEIVELGLDRLDDSAGFFESGFVSDCNRPVHCAEVSCVYPGDVNNDEVVSQIDYLYGSVAMAKDSVFESPRSFTSGLWQGYDAADRTLSFVDNDNYKHADCNGDGRVSFGDLSTVVTNFGLKTPMYISGQIDCSPYPGDGQIRLNLSEILTSTSESTNFEFIEIEGFEQIHGFSFTLEYDPNVFAPGFDMFSVLSQNIFGSLFMYNTDIPGREVYASSVSGNQNEDIELFSTAFKLNLQETITASKTEVRLTDIFVIDFDENFYCLDDVVQEVDFEDISITTDLTSHQTSVFPNPTTNQITIKSDGGLVDYQLFNLDGRSIQSGSISDNKSIDVSDLKGVYHLLLSFDDGSVWSERVVVLE